MIKKNLVALLCTGLVYNATYSQVIKNYNQADGLAVTDTLNLANLKFGVTRNGGGMINKLGLIIGGNVVDIMNGTSRDYTKPHTSPAVTYSGISESKTFGRGGQSTIRDAAHRGRYNPTQAGFNEFLGTPVNITKSARTLNIADYKMALWYGDGEYDFTSWENIGTDVYTPFANPLSTIGFDDDDVNESVSPYLLPNKQLDEVGSEFNYYGTYTDYTSTINPTNSTAIASVVRNFFEMAFVGESSNANLGSPANCLKQFQNGFIRTVNKDIQPNGTAPILNTNSFRNPIFKTIPPLSSGYNFSSYGANGANGTGDSYDMNWSLVPFRLRYDTQKWQNVNQVVYINKNGGIVTSSFPFLTNGALVPPTTGTNALVTDNTLIGISDGTTVLAIYRPNTNINNNFIIGRNAPGRPVAIYQDNRMITPADKVNTSASYSSGGSVTNSLGVFGFVTAFSGMYNRHRLPANVYEVFRAEYYIISGPKSTLAATIAAIDGSLTIVNSATNPIAVSNFGNDIAANASTIKIEVYPNPVTNLLNVKLSSSKATDISIFNEAGKLVFTKASVIGNVAIPKTQIGGAGVYFIKTETETKQFIIAQ